MPKPPHKDLPNLGKDYFWLDTVADNEIAADMHVYRDTRDNQLWALHEYEHGYGEWFKVRSRSVVIYEAMGFDW